jgi:hypothetical protein
MLTREQRNAIRCLKRLARRWPKGIWLFSGESTLWVMRDPPEGEDTCEPGGGSVRQDLCVTAIPGIPNDGGGW